MNDCPRCGKEPAIKHPLYGKLQGKLCVEKDRKKVGEIKPPPEFPTLSMGDRITQQRIKYEKDIIQPWNGSKPNPDFVKAYPDMANEYFSKDELEKI